MTADKMVLVIIDHAGGTLRGKTLLQKRGYFLSILLQLELGFKAHYYGPFSPYIESGLAKAKALGFVQERALGFGGSDKIGFEVRRYDYALTDDGKEILSLLERKDRDEVGRIRNQLDVLKDAGDVGNYMDLSIAAKICHVLSKQISAMTPEDISNAAENLGWDIDRGAANRGIEFLQNLNLVTVD